MNVNPESVQLMIETISTAAKEESAVLVALSDQNQDMTITMECMNLCCEVLR